MKQENHQRSSSRAHSRQEGRHSVHQQDSSEQITRTLQQMSEVKPSANSKLVPANQKQKSSSRPDILGGGEPN